MDFTLLGYSLIVANMPKLSQRLLLGAKSLVLGFSIGEPTEPGLLVEGSGLNTGRTVPLH